MPERCLNRLTRVVSLNEGRFPFAEYGIKKKIIIANIIVVVNAFAIIFIAVSSFSFLPLDFNKIIIPTINIRAIIPIIKNFTGVTKTRIRTVIHAIKEKVQNKNIEKITKNTTTRAVLHEKEEVFLVFIPVLLSVARTNKQTYNLSQVSLQFLYTPSSTSCS